jgi:hypothetical protein
LSKRASYPAGESGRKEEKEYALYAHFSRTYSALQ